MINRDHTVSASRSAARRMRDAMAVTSLAGGLGMTTTITMTTTMSCRAGMD